MLDSHFSFIVENNPAEEILGTKKLKSITISLARVEFTLEKGVLRFII